MARTNYMRVASVLLISSLLAAAPVHAAFLPVSFDDGGSLSGSFTYSPDGNRLTTWDISTAGGTAGIDSFEYSDSLSIEGGSTASIGTNAAGGVDVIFSPNLIATRFLAISFGFPLSPTNLPTNGSLIPVTITPDCVIDLVFTAVSPKPPCSIEQQGLPGRTATTKVRHVEGSAFLFVSDPPSDPITFTLTGSAISSAAIEPSSLFLIATGFITLTWLGWKARRKVRSGYGDRGGRVA